jgi:hypothetical protein
MNYCYDLFDFECEEIRTAQDVLLANAERFLRNIRKLPWPSFGSTRSVKHKVDYTQPNRINFGVVTFNGNGNWVGDKYVREYVVHDSNVIANGVYTFDEIRDAVTAEMLCLIDEQGGRKNG